MYSSLVGLLSFLIGKQPGYRLAVDNEPGMPLAGGYLHQPVCAVPGIEPERLPHEQQRCRHDEADADPLVHARHEQDDEHHEHGEQAARKDEKVLAFQPLELHRLADAPVYRIFCHTPTH